MWLLHHIPRGAREYRTRQPDSRRPSPLEEEDRTLHRWTDKRIRPPQNIRLAAPRPPQGQAGGLLRVENRPSFAGIDVRLLRPPPMLLLRNLPAARPPAAFLNSS